MQRISIFIIIALILLTFYYYKPLRNIIAPEKKSTSSLSSHQKSSDDENAFDELRIELYAITNKVANLQGKIQVLKIAQENRDWLTDEEYSHLPFLIEEAGDELKQAEAEYEKVKNRYVRETVAKMIHKSLEKQEERKDGSSEEETLPENLLE